MSITGASDAEFYAGVDEITGYLRVTPFTASDIELPSLVSIGTGISPESPNNNHTIRGVGASSVSLPALETVFGSLGIYTASISFPSLASVSALLDISNTPQLQTIELPGLVSVDTINIINNGALQTISTPNLTSVGSVFRIMDNPLLPTCQAEAIRDQLSPPLPLAQIAIIGNDDGGTCP